MAFCLTLGHLLLIMVIFQVFCLCVVAFKWKNYSIWKFSLFFFLSFGVRKSKNFAETQITKVVVIFFRLFTKKTFITWFFFVVCCCLVCSYFFMYHFTPHNSLAKSNKLSSNVFQQIFFLCSFCYLYIIE